MFNFVPAAPPSPLPEIGHQLPGRGEHELDELTDVDLPVSVCVRQLEREPGLLPGKVLNNSSDNCNL